MPDKDLKSILGDPENQINDLTSVLGEPESKKKVQESVTPMATSESKSDSVTPLENSNNFYPPTESETPSIKSKQTQIIQERTKKQFFSNPLFQESNPNAEKNKETYINTLVNKGYKRSDLELESKAVNRAKQELKEKGFWDKTEGEISEDFWNKTIEAAKEGYNQVKQAFSEPLKTEEGKPIDANTPITKIDIAKPVTKAIVGGTTALFSPVIGAFGEITDAIKSAADKTLPEPAAKVVGEALPTVFSLAHKAADALGYNPKEDSAGQHLLSIADMIIGGKVLHTPIKGYERIKSMEDLKEISQKAAKGELNPEELKSYEKVVDDIKNTSLADVKKVAEESNTPQGDVIASKIADIEKTSIEHKVSPEIEARDNEIKQLQEQSKKRGNEIDKLYDIPKSVISTLDRIDTNKPVDPIQLSETSNYLYSEYNRLKELKSDPKRMFTTEQINYSMDELGKGITELENHKNFENNISNELRDLYKKKSELESDKQKLEEKNPGSGSVLDNAINDVTAKLEDAHNAEGDLTAGEGLNNVIHSELDGKIAELEASKEGLSESGKESIDKQIQELKTQKDALQIESPNGQVSHSIEGGENKAISSEGVRSVEQRADAPEAGQEKTIEEPVNELPTDNTGVIDNVTENNIPTQEPGATKVTHAETAEMRKELGMEPRVKAPEITQEMREAGAEKWMKEGGNIERLLSDIENKSIEESVAEKTALNKYLGGLKEKAKSAIGEDLNKLIDEQKRVIDALDKTGSEAGSLLQLRKDLIENDDSLLGMLTREKVSSGVDMLTEGQEKSIKDKYAEYEAAIEKEKLANEELQAQIGRFKAGESVKAIRKSSKVKKTHEQYVTERKEYINSAKEKLAKLRQSSQSVIVPYANELIAITPEVGKLVKSLAEEGIDKLDDVIEAVHKEFKELVPDLTKKDVLDVIAGEHKEAKTREAVATDLENLKAEAKLINKLEQLKSGERPITEKKKIEYNQKVKDLKDQIKALKKENKIIDEAAGLERIAARNKKATEELEKRIETKDFEPKKRKSLLNDVELKKKFPEQYKKALDSWIEKNDKKLELEMRFLDNQRLLESKGAKATRLAKEGLATAKSLQAGIDLSAIMVQNSKAIMANPVIGVKGIIHQFGDLVSKERFDRGLAEIHNSEAWPLIKKSGLEILDPKSLKESEHEDYFAENWFKKKFKVNGKETHLGKYTTDAFERAYTSLGNYMRVELFLREAELLESQGKTFETHEKLYKDIAKDINNSTGRGHLPPVVKTANNLINPFIWSSRLMASALNTLGLSDIGNAMRGRKGYYGRMEPQARKFAATQTAKMAGTGLAIMATYNMMGYKTDLDPRSPTFGTIQDNDGFTYNVFGQLSPYVRLSAELATNEIISKGKVKKLGERGTTKTKESELIKFIRGRTTPFAGFAWSAITGKNYDKSDFNALESAKDMVTPMSLKPLYEAVKKDEPLQYILKRSLGITGLKVSHQKDFQKSLAERKAERLKMK